ncbi:MAG: hypothetical protein GX444_06955 [Myxococcales bacterium]|nr:hypothetical protein [Myxococcales bacterium]
MACAAYDGYLYALGGTPDGSTSLTDNAIYDIDGNSWSTGTAIPYGFMWGAATALADGTIWIAGGYTTFGTELATVEIYDIAGNSWSAGTSLNTGRAGLGLATDGETVYTYGGGWYTYLTTVEYYDDSKGSWVAFSDLLNTGRRTFGFDFGSGFMVAIEGYNGSYSNAFDYYAFEPTVASINPPSGETDDAAVAVTILGTNFVDGETTVTLSGPVSKADIEGTNVVVANPGELSCDFDLTGAATGGYDVVVTTPAGEDTLAAGFEVTEAADDDDDDNDDNDTGDDDNDDNDDNDTGGDDDDTGADDDDNDDAAADDDNDSGGDDDDDDDSGCGC